MKIIFFLLIISKLSFADDDFKIIEKKKFKKVEKKDFVISKSKPKVNDLEKLEELSKSTNVLLGKYQERSGIWDYSSEYDLKTGTVIKGILLNSIVSTNLESPMLVEVTSNSRLPEKTIFSCKGVTKYQRVMAACNRLILPNKDEEYEVQAGILNMDGSAGLKADEVYTGKEEYVAATIASAFSKGLIELKTERIATQLGELTANTAKNRLMNGVMESMNETNNLMKDEMQNKEPKVYVKSGRNVLIYFFERFKI